MPILVYNPLAEVVSRPRALSCRRSRHLLMAAAILPALALCVWQVHFAAAATLQDGTAELVLVSAPASYLGVNIRDLDEHAAHLLNLKSTAGAEVIAVDRDSPAGKAGIHLRDVVLAVNGRAVADAQQFREILRGYSPGKEVVLSVVRDGKPMKFTVKLADRLKMQQQAYLDRFRPPMPALTDRFSDVFAGARPEGFIDPPVEDPDGNLPQAFGFFGIGAELDSIGPQLASYFGVKDGTGLLVKSVEAGSPAAAAGLQAGDVVLKLNDEPLNGPLDCLRGIEASRGRPMQLTIVRNKRIETMTLPALPRTQAQLDVEFDAQIS